VLATDAPSNTVTVGPRGALAAGSLTLAPVRMHERPEAGDEPLEVRVRYRGRALRGRAAAEGEGLRVDLLEDADGVAPGQTAALYRGGRLVAAGTIVAAAANRKE
jgi:tRNA-specific 2-thiouridylase